MTIVFLDLHLKNQKKIKKNPSKYRTSEMLIIFNICARYRSIRCVKQRNIAKNSSSQRILLPAIPPSGGPRHCNSVKILFARNAIHDFFYWTSSRHCPYTSWKYVKYILPLEGVEMFYVDFPLKLLHTYFPQVETRYAIRKIFFLRSILF